MSRHYDFCGWATKNDLRCSDGRTIRRDAFKECDGKTVPLVWNHNHDDPTYVLGHALLENNPDGVIAYGSFNDSELAQQAKMLVKHGDVVSLSIYANQLKQNGGDVLHGAIREVSLVLAGANPGAAIVSALAHADGTDAEAYIYTGEGLQLEDTLEHSDEPESGDISEPAEPEEELAHADEGSKGESNMAGEKTVKDVLDTLNDEQSNVVMALIAAALEEGKSKGDDVKHNIFESDYEDEENTLSHSDLMEIISDGKRYGSLKESFLQHGITDIDYLFPEPKLMNNPPDWISRDMDWVKKVMGGVHHTPFSRIKSQFADITADDARAKGYTKGNRKVEEVFTLLKRTTTPTTVYKKQKLDRDDVIDITDFDVIAWLKGEMRFMLDEELARAFLIGDGRLGNSDDKINESNIRPIWTDDTLYTVNQLITVGSEATDADKAKAFIEGAIRCRKNYKGSGNPTLFTTEDMLTEMLLLTDEIGRDLYDSVDKLATKMRVKEIITVPVMENKTRTVTVGTGNEAVTTNRTLGGILVNLNDYNVGADKGGAVNMFDDFDIDYNQQKYLIETRCSGALTKPYSAVALEFVVSGN